MSDTVNADKDALPVHATHTEYTKNAGYFCNVTVQTAVKNKTDTLHYTRTIILLKNLLEQLLFSERQLATNTA